MFKHQNFIKTGNSDEVRYCCPKCDDTKYHLYFNIRKKTFYCQKCGYKGYSKNNVNYKFEYIKKERKFEGELPKDSLPIIDGKGKIEREAISFLERRGLNKDDFKKYNLHYCISGKFKNRIIFPFLMNNKLVYYSSRTFDKKYKEKNIEKTLNSYGDKNVYNIERASKYGGRILVVEGIIDCILSGDNCISILGKNMTDKQAEIINDYGIKDITLMFDSYLKDNKTEKECFDYAFDLSSRIKRYFRSINIISLPFGDPGEWKFRERNLIDGWKGLFDEKEYSFSNKLKNIQLVRS